VISFSGVIPRSLVSDRLEKPEGSRTGGFVRGRGLASGSLVRYPVGMPRRGHDNRDYLFWSYDFYGVQEACHERLRKAVDDADPAAIQEGTVEEAGTRIAEGFRLEAPELTEGAISVDIEEARVDVTGDFQYAAYGPGPHLVPGIRASYFVPFVGDAEMFKVKPTTFTTVNPAAAIEKNELRFTFERPGQPVEETKKAFDEDFSRVKQYLGWLKQNVTTLNDSLIPLAQQRVAARRARLAELQKGTSSLGIHIRRVAPPASAPSARPRISPRSRTPRPVPQQTYDIALSFAGEDRAYVQEVAHGLEQACVAVFYDEFEKAALWGKNLVDHLADIYQNRTRYVVMFISEAYVSKAWPTHERQHAQARALLAKEEYILPARFDDTDVPGLTNTVGHIDLRTHTAEQLVDVLLKKLGRDKKA
jgi:hypothetical protein